MIAAAIHAGAIGGFKLCDRAAAAPAAVRENLNVTVMVTAVVGRSGELKLKVQLELLFE